MIDFHSHILPKLDDGSQSTQESVALLRLLAQQGVETVVATPHFYADYEKSVAHFLEHRAASFERLRPFLSADLPQVLLGAEVQYYPGISRMEDLQKLRIADSRLLLLEMPMTRWTEYTLQELEEMASRGKTVLVLAHLERYMQFQKAEALHRLYTSGILAQLNAGFFNGFSTRRKALAMLTNGHAQFIGSDCHGLKNRPPQIGTAFKMIEKKLGQEFVSQINAFGYAQLTK